MARNCALQTFRGLKVNLPALLLGERAFCTDTGEEFIGTSTGNFPLTIPVFNAAGVRQLRPHVVVDSVTMTGSTQTITLSGGAAFTSATSYVAAVVTSGIKRTLTIVQNSGSSFTVSGGGSGDVLHYICIGT